MSDEGNIENPGRKLDADMSPGRPGPWVIFHLMEIESFQHIGVTKIYSAELYETQTCNWKNRCPCWSSPSVYLRNTVLSRATLACWVREVSKFWCLNHRFLTLKSTVFPIVSIYSFHGQSPILNSQICFTVKCSCLMYKSTFFTHPPFLMVMFINQELYKVGI